MDSQSAQFTELNKSLESLTKEVSALKLDNSILYNNQKLIESRLVAFKKVFSETIKSSLPTFINKSDISYEMQLRFQYARNIIIRGAPELLDSPVPKRVTDDIFLICR